MCFFFIMSQPTPHAPLLEPYLTKLETKGALSAPEQAQFEQLAIVMLAELSRTVCEPFIQLIEAHIISPPLDSSNELAAAWPVQMALEYYTEGCSSNYDSVTDELTDVLAEADPQSELCQMAKEPEIAAALQALRERAAAFTGKYGLNGHCVDMAITYNIMLIIDAISNYDYDTLNYAMSSGTADCSGVQHGDLTNSTSFVEGTVRHYARKHARHQTKLARRGAEAGPVKKKTKV